jgi:hypothetical protein
VNDFVIEPIRYTVSASGFAFVTRSVTPKPLA